MKLFILVFLGLLLIASPVLAKITAEITEIKEVASGILNIEVTFYDGLNEIERKTYTIADSPTAIEYFKTVEIPKNIATLPKEEVIAEEVKPVKTYNIKVGDVIK